MKSKPAAQALITVLALVLAAIVAAACGGDRDGEALTVEQYFRRLETLKTQFEGQPEPLARFEGLPEADIIEQLPEIFAQHIAAFEAFNDGLADLDPPAEAEELHQEALDAFEDALTAYGEVEDKLDDVESFADVEQLFSQGDAAAAEARLDQVCLDAEQLAAENGIDIDLNCEDEE